MYERRFYRDRIVHKDLVDFEVVVRETDLLVSAESSLEKEAEVAIKKYRRDIEEYIEKFPQFKASLVPLRPEAGAPEIVRAMHEAANGCGVGPMAAVAGAMAEFVARDLLRYTKQVIVENGGDIFIKSEKPRKIAVFAGRSPLSEKFNIVINPDKTPLGICASSRTVGPSLSFGNTDATVIIAKSAVLADAAATAVGNAVKDKQTIKRGIDIAKSIKGLTAAIIIIGKDMGMWGKLKLQKSGEIAVD